MQMPYQSQALQAERRSSSDLPPSFPAMEMGQNGSMESLDGLDMGLFAAQQSNSMPDYSDLTQAASQLQVAPRQSLFCGRLAAHAAQHWLLVESAKHVGLVSMWPIAAAVL